MDEKRRDIHLLKMIAKGSKNAFDEFYEKHASFVLNIANQVVKDNVEAEDIMHDIFLSIYEHPERYNKKRGTVKAFLAVMTKNRAIERPYICSNVFSSTSETGPSNTTSPSLIPIIRSAYSWAISI